MTPNEIGQILKELGGICARLDDQGQTINQILAEAKKTNGRVSAIEAREGEIDAVAAERRRVAALKAEQRQRWGGYFQPIVTGVVMVVLGAAIIAALNIEKL